MQPTNAGLQVLYGTIPLSGVILLAMWNNNARLNEVSKRIHDIGKRIAMISATPWVNEWITSLTGCRLSKKGLG